MAGSLGSTKVINTNTKASDGVRVPTSTNTNAAVATQAATTSAPKTTTAALTGTSSAANKSAAGNTTAAVNTPVVQNAYSDGTRQASTATGTTASNSLARNTSSGLGNTASVAANAAIEEAAAEEAAPAVAPYSLTSESAQKTREYLNTYNQDREQKIRDMYAGNIAAQNAAQQTAYDRNMNALRTAYEANLGNLKTAYDNNSASLKTAYDKNLAQIANTYQQNLSDAEAYREGISPRYHQAMNALGAEYERQRRNNNMQAAVNGLNTGAGSQMALGQSMAYQANQGNLARSENEALNEADRGINDLNRAYNNQQDILNTEYANNVDKLNREYANQQATYGTTYQNNMLDLKTNYQNKIAEAAANNDYQLAAALLDEYGAQYDRTMQQASQLAEFGDFSMYADIYGIDAAQQMEKMWSYQNPDLAYNLGRITADEYFNMTGKYPSGYGTDNNYYHSDRYSDANLLGDKLMEQQIAEGGIAAAKASRVRNYWEPGRGGGRGYSKSLDKAYRGAPGYLNTSGQFYVPGYSDPSQIDSTPYNQAEADKLAGAYGWTAG